jgi:hypothetical protein
MLLRGAQRAAISLPMHDRLCMRQLPQPASTQFRRVGSNDMVGGSIEDKIKLINVDPSDMPRRQYLNTCM